MSNKTSPIIHIISCHLEDEQTNYELFYNEVAFITSVVVAALSPVAVAGNALILAAIWKKTFQRTPFHILLSGLAFTDLCTGLIALPFYSATTAIYVARSSIFYDKPALTNTLNTISECSAIYFISLTVLLITLMSVERWLHMYRRSLVTSWRGYFTVIILLVIPVPIVSFRVYKMCGNTVHIMIIALLFSCFLVTSFTCFKVYRIIRLHQQQVHANETSQNFGQPAIDLAKYKKSVSSLLYILLLFSFCFLPFTVTTCVYISVGLSLDIFLADRVCMVLLFSSSAINPGLYVWRMNDIRNGVKKIFCRDE